jgi:hypothetical protein
MGWNQEGYPAAKLCSKIPELVLLDLYEGLRALIVRFLAFF